MNGCRDGYGNRDEPQCGPFKTPDGWESYEGVSNALGCCGAVCLCAGVFFFITLSALYNSSATYCNYLPSLNGSVDADLDQIVGVATDYCNNAGFGHNMFQYTIAGVASSTGDVGQHAFSTSSPPFL